MRKIRDVFRFLYALIFSWIYIPHLIVYICIKSKNFIDSDLIAIKDQIALDLPLTLQLLFHLHNNRYFRNVFYHRIGVIKSALIGWYRPGDRYFTIGKSCYIGKSFWFAHPYATIIAANSIGDNFRCIHCTTLGNTDEGRPTIGDNVSLGANVTIIGPVTIGNNVTIAAGAVVVKDIPDNCVVAGVPAKIIRLLNFEKTQS